LKPKPKPTTTEEVEIVICGDGWMKAYAIDGSKTYYPEQLVAVENEVSE
jgi:hypothetical protein